MKETNLGKYYVQILNIAETSPDAKRLLHWRKPTADTVRLKKKKIMCFCLDKQILLGLCRWFW